MAIPQEISASQRRNGSHMLSSMRGAMWAAAIAFGIFAPRLVPSGAAAAETKFLMVLVYTAVIALGSWLLWRRDDELVRRRAVNTFAAMGLTSFFLTIIVMTAVPVFNLHNPAMFVWTASLIVGGLAYLTQRLRD